MVVIFSGRLLELASYSVQAQIIFQAWFPGTEGGNALADLLLGRDKPCNRIHREYPQTVGLLPLGYNYLPVGRPKQGNVNSERSRSRYPDAPNEPLYPFGHWLTYASFRHGEVTLSQAVLTPSETIDSQRIACQHRRYARD